MHGTVRGREPRNENSPSERPPRRQPTVPPGKRSSREAACNRGTTRWARRAPNARLTSAGSRHRTAAADSAARRRRRHRPDYVGRHRPASVDRFQGLRARDRLDSRRLRRRRSAPQPGRRRADRDRLGDGDGRRRRPRRSRRRGQRVRARVQGRRLVGRNENGRCNRSVREPPGQSGGVTRLRTALEGSQSLTIASRMALTPRVELRIRQDGGDGRCRSRDRRRRGLGAGRRWDGPGCRRTRAPAVVDETAGFGGVQRVGMGELRPVAEDAARLHCAGLSRLGRGWIVAVHSVPRREPDRPAWAGTMLLTMNPASQ